MQYSIINKLIAKGYYNEALKEIDGQKSEEINRAYALKSRIAELNGRFLEARNLAEEAITRSESIKDNIGMIEGLIAKTYCLWRLFEFPEAIKTVEYGLELLGSQQNSDKIISLLLKGSLLNLLGLIFWKLNKLDKAMNKFEESLGIRNNLENLSDISYTLNNIGNTYLSQNNFDLANFYYEKSYKIRNDLCYDPGIAASFNSFGRLNDSKREFETAQNYHFKSLDLWKKVGNQQFIAKSFRFIGNHYLIRKEYKLALSHFERGLRIFDEIKNKIDSEVTQKMINSIAQ